MIMDENPQIDSKNIVIINSVGRGKSFGLFFIPSIKQLLTGSTYNHSKDIKSKKRVEDNKAQKENPLIDNFKRKHSLKFNITDCRVTIKSCTKKLKKVSWSFIKYVFKTGINSLITELIKTYLPEVIKYFFSDTDDNTYITPCIAY